jgi:hypothetical protein
VDWRAPQPLEATITRVAYRQHSLSKESSAARRRFRAESGLRESGLRVEAVAGCHVSGSISNRADSACVANGPRLNSVFVISQDGLAPRVQLPFQ